MHRAQLRRLPATTHRTVHALISAQSFTAGSHIVLSAIAGDGERTAADHCGLFAVAKAKLPR